MGLSKLAKAFSQHCCLKLQVPQFEVQKQSSGCTKGWLDKIPTADRGDQHEQTANATMRWLLQGAL